jgi:hypothetical protein
MTSGWPGKGHESLIKNTNGSIFDQLTELLLQEAWGRAVLSGRELWLRASQSSSSVSDGKIAPLFFVSHSLKERRKPARSRGERRRKGRQGDVTFMEYVTLADFLRGAWGPACASVLAGFSRGSRRSLQSAGRLPEKPARRYTLSKIWPDSRHIKGPEPRNVSVVEAPTP